MTAAGYAKGPDGLYVTAAGDRVTTDVKVTAGPQFERGNAILIASWKQNGFDMTSSTVAAAEARDREARQTFPGLASRGASEILRIFLTSEIGAPANRWLGDNRGGWSNADYDRLYDTYATTLDRTERDRQFAQLLKIQSEQLPAYTLYFQTHVVTSVAALRGPTDKTIGTEASRSTLPYWNINDWTWAS
jgi:ABC-type transport system substrate-binding protein